MSLRSFFASLDKISFLQINVWEFSYLSLFREYARLFFLKAMLSHPQKTIQGFCRYQNLVKSEKYSLTKPKSIISIPDESIFIEKVKKQRSMPIVGLGFCLKPDKQENFPSSCPSGRANHDCLYLEKGETYPACNSCSIREISIKCLNSGYSVYIMTSARDIALDVLIPQINQGKFPSAILFLCPYSINAIIPALLICEIDMVLFPYSSGYCQEYHQWLQADIGIKKERTTLSTESIKKLLYILDKTGKNIRQFQRFKRQGYIFFPE
ncbi:MAG: hypothetical protein ACETWK_09670 [Candidatus Aminicenantaceae bacterium]